MLRDTIDNKCLTGAVNRDDILDIIQESILLTCDGDIIATSEDCPLGESHIVLKGC